MIGNVWELNETPFNGLEPSHDLHTLRGGGATYAFGGESTQSYSSIDFQTTFFNDVDFFLQGFRVASVPEPSGNSLWIVLLLVLSRRAIRDAFNVGNYAN